MSHSNGKKANAVLNVYRDLKGEFQLNVVRGGKGPGRSCGVIQGLSRVELLALGALVLRAADVLDVGTSREYELEQVR